MTKRIHKLFPDIPLTKILDMVFLRFGHACSCAVSEPVQDRNDSIRNDYFHEIRGFISIQIVSIALGAIKATLHMVMERSIR